MMKEFEVSGHVPSLVPEGREWKLVWADEFDGTELDRTKWDYRLYMMGKRHPTWVDDGVTLDGESHAVFHIFERDGDSGKADEARSRAEEVLSPEYEGSMKVVLARHRWEDLPKAAAKALAFLKAWRKK